MDTSPGETSDDYVIDRKTICTMTASEAEVNKIVNYSKTKFYSSHLIVRRKYSPYIDQQKFKRPLDPEIVRRLIETRLQEEKFEAEKWNVPQLVYNQFEPIDWESNDDECVEDEKLERITCKRSNGG